MEDKSYPDVASFLIRFIQDQPDTENDIRFHAVVRHVQTEHELVFTCWEDVEFFIQQVIPLENFKKNQRSKT